LNRHERRRLEREGKKVKKPTMVSTDIIEKHVQKEIDTIYESASRATAKTMFQVIAIALHNEFNFGTSRIRRAINRMNYQYDCMAHDTLKQEDVNQMLRELKLQELL